MSYLHTGRGKRATARGKPLLWRLTRLLGLCGGLTVAVLLVFSLLTGGTHLNLTVPASVRKYIDQPWHVETPPVRELATDTANQIREKAAAQPGNPGATFSIGSSEAEVLRIQGRPTRISGNTWYYADSEVRFVAGRVVAWRTTSETPLRVSQ